jgi:hypothetical protein
VVAMGVAVSGCDHRTMLSIDLVSPTKLPSEKNRSELRVLVDRRCLESDGPSAKNRITQHGSCRC